MKFVVVSHKHHLLPFAWRLKSEGHEVEVAQVGGTTRYEKAWAGRFDSFLNGIDKKGDELWGSLRDAATEAGAVVLTNSIRCTEALAGYPQLYGRLPEREPTPPGGLWMGAWFDGEGWHAPHLTVDDMGAWTGGQGPPVPGATTLVRLPGLHPWDEVLSRETDYLKSKGFKGLVAVALLVTKEFVVQPIGMVAGWPGLHTHVWVSELDPWAAVFGGASPVLPTRFVVGAVVSVPPWPSRPADPIPEVAIQVVGPNPAEVRRNTFFHDMQVDGDVLRTVGLDGFVAVVRGQGGLLATARHRCQLRCGAMRVAGGQWRLDAGVSAAGLVEVLDVAGQLGLVGL